MYPVNMDRRTAAEGIARNIETAAAAAGVPLPSVSQATDVPMSSLLAHPSGPELSVNDLVAVGGLLRVSPAALLEVAS